MLILTLLAMLACENAGNAGTTAKVAPAGPPPPAATAPAGTPDAGVVATWEGGSLTYGEVKGDIRGEIVRLEAEYLSNRYETEYAAVEERVNAALLEAEAKKRGLADAMALLKEEVEAKAAAPTEAEVKELYDANARRMRGKTLEEVRPDVEAAVRQRKQGERYQVYIEELRKKYGANVTLPFPDLPRFEVSADDDPFQGPAAAPVTIVQFAEFQCPFCGKAREALDQVLKDYPDQVRIVFRDFPLGFHGRAIPAAVAANCAADQGKYWEVHDKLMANQQALEEADLERVARDVGLDIQKWKTCRDDPAREAEIRKDMADGQAVGVSGTPAFFINGIMLSGAQPYEKFKAVIDRELAAKG